MKTSCGFSAVFVVEPFEACLEYALFFLLDQWDSFCCVSLWICFSFDFSSSNSRRKIAIRPSEKSFISFAWTFSHFSSSVEIPRFFVWQFPVWVAAWSYQGLGNVNTKAGTDNSGWKFPRTTVIMRSFSSFSSKFYCNCKLIVLVVRANKCNRNHQNLEVHVCKILKIQWRNFEPLLVKENSEIVPLRPTGDCSVFFKVVSSVLGLFFRRNFFPNFSICQISGVEIAILAFVDVEVVLFLLTARSLRFKLRMSLLFRTEDTLVM